MGQSVKVNQRLEDRSRLIFTFPQPAGESSLIRVCPFFENPIIRERKTSNLVKYDALGRPGQLFGYTGAKSRQLDVEFNINLPLVFDLASRNFSTDKIKQETDEDLREKFFEQLETQSDAAMKATKWNVKRDEFLKLINDGTMPTLGIVTPSPPATAATGAGAAAAVAGAVVAPPTSPEDSEDVKLATHINGAYSKSHLYAQAVEIIVYWIGLIRSSTMNNYMNPTLGPPIIKIKHGILYDRISTVAQNYSIALDDMAGYDVVSLLPNRIKVSLSLLEIQKNPSDVPGDVEETIYGWERNVDNAYLKRLTQGDGKGLDFGGAGIWKNVYGK